MRIPFCTVCTLFKRTYQINLCKRIPDLNHDNFLTGFHKCWNAAQTLNPWRTKTWKAVKKTNLHHLPDLLMDSDNCLPDLNSTFSCLRSFNLFSFILAKSFSSLKNTMSILYITVNIVLWVQFLHIHLPLKMVSFLVYLFTWFFK